MSVSAKEIERRMTAFVAACAQHGVTATHQRREIYREVARSDEHPDVQAIYRRVRRRIPAVSLDTVYRTLRLLEAKGIVDRVACLEARTRFDAFTDRHHHFTCVVCGRIVDLQSDSLDRVAVPPEAAAMGTVQSVHVELRGVCAACRSAPAAATR